SRTFYLVDPLRCHRFVGLERSDFGVGGELGRDQLNRLPCAASVGSADHFVRIQSVTRRPAAPGALDALRGIDEDAIQIEQYCLAAKDTFFAQGANPSSIHDGVTDEGELLPIR